MKLKSKITYAIGGLVAAGALVLGSAFIVHPAISALVGLSVAQTATQWNNVRDASAGDNLTNGILMTSIGLFDGTNFDRIRGDVANGMDVDVTRVSGNVNVVGTDTPADAFTNPTDALSTYSLGGVWNGATWDLRRGVSATNNTAVTSRGIAYSTPLSTWTVTHSPAVNTQAIATKAAGGGTVRHVMTAMTACVHALAAAVGQNSLTVQLRDGASGAGTVLWTWYFSVEVTDESRHIPCVTMSGLNITGSPNTAMTLEFTAGSVFANVAETVSMAGYSTP